MTAPDLVELIARMAASVARERDNLNRLDAALGDGDHGSSISGALMLAVEKVAALENPTCHAIWLTTAKALMNGMGGASGAIFGTFFLRGAARLKGVESVEHGILSAMLQDGLAGVQARGRATTGDKTMVDALAPAVAAFAAESDFGSAWQAAADAAKQGAESTRNLVAKQGRAKYLGERGIGHIDPGAMTIAIMFQATANPPRAIDSVGARR